MIALLTIGFVSILMQAVLLRELSVAFYGVDLIYILSLGIWLAWTALGAMIGRRHPAPSTSRLFAIFLFLALAFIPDLIFIRSLRVLFAPAPGAFLPFAQQILAMSAVLCPIGILSGLLFPSAARMYLGPGRTLAGAYALESAGGLTGGLAATLLLKIELSNLTIGILSAIVPLAVVFASRNRTGPIPRAAAFSGTLVMLALLAFSGRIDRRMTAWSHPHLLDTRDTPYGRITVTEAGGQIAVYENDALCFETESTEAEEFVHLAALMHPHPARVLILGGGFSGIVNEILKHSPELVDVVETNPGYVEAVLPRLPSAFQDALKAAPVKMHLEDPRRFLNHASDYDLILAGAPEPDSGQTNRFYTQEFFTLCATHLLPEGILAFRLKSSENFWTPQQTARAVSIYQALRSALSCVQVIPGTVDLFVASRQPLETDPDRLAARLRDRRIEARLVSEPYIRYRIENERFAVAKSRLANGSALPNSDAQPVCYRYTLMIWLSKFYPELAAWIPDAPESWKGIRNTGWGGLLLIAGILWWVGRRGSILSSSLFIGVTSFAGMVMETVLVLHYQVKSGILYQDIGILLMSFMAGLALGSPAAEAGIRSVRGRIRPWFGVTVAGGMAGLSLIIGLLVRTSSGNGLIATGGMLLAAGFLVSAAFAFAARVGGADQGEAAAPIYAADVAGGCLGSLAASLALIPWVGLSSAAVTMAPVAVMGALLLKKD